MAGFSSLIWPFFFWGKRIWAQLLLKCLCFVPWVRLYWQQFGKHIASTRILLPSQVSKPSIVTQATTTTQLKGRKEKRIRSCVAIRARLFSIYSWKRWVCDWRMDQSVDFWPKDIRLMLPRPKFGNTKLLPIIDLRKKLKFILIRSDVIRL